MGTIELTDLGDPAPENKTINVHVEKIPYFNIADANVLGLVGTAASSLVLAMTEFGATGDTILTIPWVVFGAGFLSLFAGTLSYLRGDMFNGTINLSFSMVWLILGWGTHTKNFADPSLLPTDPALDMHLGVGIAAYFIIALIFLVGTMTCNIASTVLLTGICVALFSLVLKVFAGTSGIPVGIGLMIMSLSSLYIVAASVWNNLAGGEVLPLGPPLFTWDRFVTRKKI